MMQMWNLHSRCLLASLPVCLPVCMLASSLGSVGTADVLGPVRTRVALGLPTPPAPPQGGPWGGVWEDGLQPGLDRAALAERMRPVLLGPGCQLCPPSALLALWLRAQGPGMARRT